MSSIIKYSSFVVTLIIVFTSLSYASPPPNFTKVNETGIALYKEFVLGIDTDEISYWIINDSTWLVRGLGINLYPQLKEDIPIMPFQIQYNNLNTCKDVMNQLPEPLDSSIDSSYIYRISLVSLPSIDTINCIEKIVACNDTVFSLKLRKIPDYLLSFIDEFENDSTKFMHATSPYEFRKVDETGIALYKELILGENQSDLFVWRVSDTVWLAHHDNKKIEIKIQDDQLYLSIQVQIDTASECSKVTGYLYENKNSFMKTFYNFSLPIIKLAHLDAKNCINRIVTRYSHSPIFDMNASGYEMLYGEDSTKNSLKIYLITKKQFNSSGYRLTGEPYISNDTVIIIPRVTNTSNAGPEVFSFAGGSFHIPLTLTKYILFIDCHTDIASFDVRITDDSIHVTPLGLSSVILGTSPHKRLKKSK